MKYSSKIADAKRRARATARTTGTSYQSELENEATALGYEAGPTFSLASGPKIPKMTAIKTQTQGKSGSLGQLDFQPNDFSRI